MKSYLDLGRIILEHGERRATRNAVTTSLFAEKLTFDLTSSFPLLTTKKMAWKAIVGELIGFLRGTRDNRELQALGCPVWTANVEDPRWQSNPACFWDSDLGRFYGVQWRRWRTHHPVLDDNNIVVGYQEVDQIADLIDGLRNDPHGRRHIVTAWNPAEVGEACLPPCHVMFQCYCSDDGGLDLQMYQRSADYFLGVPFNIASYALLLKILAHMTGRWPRNLTIVFGDVHLYAEHEEAFGEQLMREPRTPPQVVITHNIDDPAHLEPSMIHLMDYDPHPSLKAEMIV